MATIVLTRIFGTRPEELWRVWTDCENIRHWWGPDGFTAPYCTNDLKVGGVYLCCMRAPDGKEYWSTGRCKEIIPPKRIVCTDSFADKEGKVVPATHYGMSADFPLELLLTVSFEEFDGKTKLTLQHEGFPAGEDRELAETGWNQSLDKLAQEVRSRA